MKYHPISEVIDEVAFTVHSLPFTVKDIIECSFLMCSFLVNSLGFPEITGFAVSIDKNNSSIELAPVKFNHDFYDIQRNIVEDYNDISYNMYYREGDEIHILLSKGFIADNFVLKEECYEDFTKSKDSTITFITAKDIEHRTLIDPEYI